MSERIRELSKEDFFELLDKLVETTNFISLKVYLGASTENKAYGIEGKLLTLYYTALLEKYRESFSEEAEKSYESFISQVKDHFKTEIPAQFRKKIHMSYLDIGTIYLVRLQEDKRVKDSKFRLEQYKKILKYHSQAIEYSENRCKVYGYVGRILARIPHHRKEMRKELIEFIKTEVLKDDPITISEETLYKAEMDLADTELDKAYAKSNFAYYYSNEKKFEESLKCSYEALELRRKNLGEDHRQTSNSYKEVGLNYLKLNNYEKAIEYCYKAFIIQKKGKFRTSITKLRAKLKDYLDFLISSGKKYIDDEKIRKEILDSEILDEKKVD